MRLIDDRLDTPRESTSHDDDDFAAFRARFPLLRERLYVNVGARGLISEAAHAAGVRVLDGHHHFILGKPEREVMRASARTEFARLIGAGADEISITQNVSHGVNWVANGIDWRAGDNIVLGGELEHPNNVFIWLSLARRLGLDVRFAPLLGAGEIDTAGLTALIDDRTRAVALASPTLAPGFRADLAAIGAAARAHDALLMVDAVQAAGVLDLNVKTLGIDALATSTSKGLLGVMGLGFLYVSRDWSPRLEPMFAAIANVDQDGSTDDSFNGTRFAFHIDGRRFEAGNTNWCGLAVARVALTELNALGISRIQAHAVGLADRLRDGLDALGFPVLHPTDPAARSHLVTLGALAPTGAASHTLDEPATQRFAEALKAHEVGHSIRRGVLRFGFHAYNNEDDVARLLEIARSIA